MTNTIDLKLRSDIPLKDQCGHGKLWSEFCRDCRISSLEHSLGWMEPRVQRDRAELEMLAAQIGKAMSADSGEERHG